MKTTKQIVIGFMTALLLAIIVIACNDSKVDPLEQSNLSSNEKQMIAVIQSAFDQENQKLMTGKDPDLSMFVDEKASRELSFSRPRMLLAKSRGQILYSGITVSPEETGFKIHLDYLYYRKQSEKEMKANQDLSDPSYEETFTYDFYLQKIGGEYKITKVKRYTMADMQSNSVPLDDEGQVFSGRDLSGDPRARISYTYNRSSAANYAKSYTINNNTTACNGYNSAYLCYSINDCSNLVSQSLRAGGVTFNNAYTSPNSASSWWYDTKGTSTTSDDVASNSWTTANGLYNHVIGTSIGSVVYNVSQMQVGDLVFAKWINGCSTGNCNYNSSYDHAMIVTATVGSPVNDVKVTYHTNDRKDKLLSAVRYESRCETCAGYCAYPVLTMVKMVN